MTKTPPKEVKTNVPIHDWKIGKLLGQGGQGGVWEVRSLKTPHSPPRAMKICTATDAASRGRFEREVATLRKVQHPGIAPLYDANVRWEVVPGTEIVCAYYVTERYPGTLASVTWWREAPIYAVAVFRQACEAIEYLHSQEPPIFHRDLKPENILFDSASERSVIAITDLGTVTGTEEGAALTQLHEVIGSRYYRSPESQYGHYDERGDVFSLGRMASEKTIARKALSWPGCSLVWNPRAPRHQSYPISFLSHRKLELHSTGCWNGLARSIRMYDIPVSLS